MLRTYQPPSGVQTFVFVVNDTLLQNKDHFLKTIMSRFFDHILSYMSDAHAMDSSPSDDPTAHPSLSGPAGAPHPHDIINESTATEFNEKNSTSNQHLRQHKHTKQNKQKQFPACKHNQEGTGQTLRLSQSIHYVLAIMYE